MVFGGVDVVRIWVSFGWIYTQLFQLNYVKEKIAGGKWDYEREYLG